MNSISKSAHPVDCILKKSEQEKLIAEERKVLREYLISTSSSNNITAIVANRAKRIKKVLGFLPVPELNTKIETNLLRHRVQEAWSLFEKTPTMENFHFLMNSIKDAKNAGIDGSDVTDQQPESKKETLRHKVREVLALFLQEPNTFRYYDLMGSIREAKAKDVPTNDIIPERALHGLLKAAHRHNVQDYLNAFKINPDMRNYQYFMETVGHAEKAGATIKDLVDETIAENLLAEALRHEVRKYLDQFKKAPSMWNYGFLLKSVHCAQNNRPPVEKTMGDPGYNLPYDGGDGVPDNRDKGVSIGDIIDIETLPQLKQQALMSEVQQAWLGFQRSSNSSKYYLLMKYMEEAKNAGVSIEIIYGTVDENTLKTLEWYYAQDLSYLRPGLDRLKTASSIAKRLGEERRALLQS